MRLACAISCIVFVAAASAIAQPQKERDRLPADAPPILRKAFAAFPKLRYTGVRIVEFKEGPERKRHTEEVIRDGQRSRVEFPEGSPFAGQIIIEDANKRLHYFPVLKEIHVLPARKDEAFGRALRMLSHRRGEAPKITTAAGETIAGVRTEQVVISDPKGNVMQRLYIDPRSGLVLKRELFDRVGTPVGSYEFSQINLNPRIDRKEFQFKIRGARWVTVEDLAKGMAKDSQMLALLLPKSSGYKLEHSRVFRAAGNPIFVQMYIGPKGRMSLFQTPGQIDKERLSRSGRGNVTTFAWQMNGKNFALVGEATAEELQRLSKLLAGG